MGSAKTVEEKVTIAIFTTYTKADCWI